MLAVQPDEAQSTHQELSTYNVYCTLQSMNTNQVPDSSLLWVFPETHYWHTANVHQVVYNLTLRSYRSSSVSQLPSLRVLLACTTHVPVHCSSCTLHVTSLATRLLLKNTTLMKGIENYNSSVKVFLKFCNNDSQ